HLLTCWIKRSTSEYRLRDSPGAKPASAERAEHKSARNRSSAEHPLVKVEGSGLCNFYSCEFIMLGIQQHVPFFFHHRRGHSERERSATGRPVGAKIATCLIVEFPPVPRQHCRIQRFDQLIGNRRARDQQIVGSFIRFEIDKKLERRQGSRG